VSAMTKLKRAVVMRSGGTPAVDDPAMWDPAGLPWVSITDMTRQPIVDQTSRRVSEAGVAAKALPVGKPGTLLFAMYASVGAVAVLGTEASWNQAILGLEPKPGLADPRFARYWLEHLKPDLLALTRSNTQDNLNAEQVGNLPFPLIGCAAQAAIADFLDHETERIDGLISARRRMIGLLEERFDAAVFRGITRGLGEHRLAPSRLTWVEEIPVGWTTPPVSANFEVQLGKMLSARAASGLEQFPYLRNTNVQWSGFDLGDLATMHFDELERRAFSLRRGDLLVCEGGEVGRAAVWEGQLSDCFFQKALHRVRPRRDADVRYLLYCLRAAAKRNVFVNEGNLSTIPHLTREQFRAHRFPWPPASEQAEIVAALDRQQASIRSAVGAIAGQIELLQERRRAVVTAAVTGQLEIAEAA
jgi:type I restriction enzyme S subunit